MQKNGKSYIIGALTIVIIILVGVLIYNNRSDGYHLSSIVVNERDDIEVNAFIMTNNKNNLINYNVRVSKSTIDINMAELYYMENNNKHLILVSGLNGYQYEDRNYAKKEYGELVDSADNFIKHIDDVYVDLYQNEEDFDNNKPYITIKLEPNKF